MAKKGVSAVSGNIIPVVGQKYNYKIASWYPATSASEKNPAKVTWELYKKRKNGKFTSTNIKKIGESDFTFGEAAAGETYRLEAYLYKPEGGGLIITPKPAKTPKINKVELFYVDDTKGTLFSFMEKLRARANCVNMLGKELVFTLWEDDAKGAGHNTSNRAIDAKKAKVNKNGIAVAEFSLTTALMLKAAQGEADCKLEFYVTVEYYKTNKHATNNVNVKNPYPQQSTSRTTSPQAPAKPKAKSSPAAQKPPSKKEEKGIWDSFTDSVSQTGGEIWDWAESLGTAVMEKSPTTPKPEGKGTSEVKKVEKPKEKFEKITGLGKEAVLYISSEIATEIKVNKSDKITSYPDYGGFNGMNEYKERGKLYCKKLPNGKSAFPLYKMYIYRGSKIGEAVKKLKQDLENQTHENAESTILTVARHAQTNNKDYGKSGPLPPNTITSLYRLRYMQAWNHAKKESFRYRIVSDTTSNLKIVEDISKEVSSGAMTLGNRGSISIDPWKSKDLIGCVGIRASDGTNHSSYSTEIKDLSATNYKYVYHSLNNYLETIVPELTGVYGRRGYSSNGKVIVKPSEFKEEVKVFVLVDNLPEISKDEKLFNEEDARKALRIIHDKYGKDIAVIVEKMYRLETAHFTSKQYKHCGTGGMEVFGSAPYYGWDSTTYKNHPEHTPIGTWSAMEGAGLSGKGGNVQQTNKPKTFVKLPTVLAGMEYKAEYIKRYDGNYARWFNKDNAIAQEAYRESLKGIKPRIVDGF